MDWPAPPVTDRENDEGGWGRAVIATYPDPAPLLYCRPKNGQALLRTFSLSIRPNAPANPNVHAFAQVDFGVWGDAKRLFVDIGRGVQFSAPATFWNIQVMFDSSLPAFGPPFPSVVAGMQYVVSASACDVTRANSFGSGIAGPVRSIYVEVPAGSVALVDIPPFANSVVFAPTEGNDGALAAATVGPVGALRAGLQETGVLPFQAMPIGLDWQYVQVNNTTGAVTVTVVLIFVLSL